jgi:hypothetical protein
MRELVDFDFKHYLSFIIGFLLWRSQESVSQDNKAYIFHAANPEFGHKHSIILFEWEWAREEFLKEKDRILNQFEFGIRICIFGLRLSAHDLHRYFKSRSVAKFLIWANCERVNVGTDGRGLFENEQVAILRNLEKVNLI